jgi:hypothetical protein
MLGQIGVADGLQLACTWSFDRCAVLVIRAYCASVVRLSRSDAVHSTGAVIIVEDTVQRILIDESISQAVIS